MDLCRGPSCVVLCRGPSCVVAPPPWAEWQQGYLVLVEERNYNYDGDQVITVSVMMLVIWSDGCRTLSGIASEIE